MTSQNTLPDIPLKRKRKITERKWMSSTEFAREFGVHPDTVKNYIRDRGLEAVSVQYRKRMPDGTVKDCERFHINIDTLSQWLRTHSIKGDKA